MLISYLKPTCSFRTHAEQNLSSSESSCRMGHTELSPFSFPPSAAETSWNMPSLFLPRALIFFFFFLSLECSALNFHASCPSSFTSEISDYLIQRVPPPGTIILPFQFLPSTPLSAMVFYMYYLSGLWSCLSELKYKFHGPCVAHSCSYDTWTSD